MAEKIMLRPTLATFSRCVRDKKGAIKRMITFQPGTPLDLDREELEAVANDIGNTLLVCQVDDEGATKIDHDLTHEVICSIAKDKLSKDKQLNPAQREALEQEKAAKAQAEKDDEDDESEDNESKGDQSESGGGDQSEAGGGDQSEAGGGDDELASLEGELETLEAVIGDFESSDVEIKAAKKAAAIIKGKITRLKNALIA